MLTRRVTMPATPPDPLRIWLPGSPLKFASSGSIQKVELDPFHSALLASEFLV